MRALLVGLCLAVASGGALAQQPQPTPPAAAAPQGASTLLTVDIDRLFGQSRFGERIARTYTEGRTALAAENRRIAEALREEELALANQRPQMDPAVFQAEAAAFDEKAQSIRRAQDAKEAALDDTLDAGRAQFLEVSRPILIQLMSDRNAAAILDRRSVLLSLERIDVTDEAIARIDETIGDGTGLEDQN